VVVIQAVYCSPWMIEGGEDVKFIARRMLILSSEDRKRKSYSLYHGQQHFSSCNVIESELFWVNVQCLPHLLRVMHH
jgi:hypothetical protein